MNYMEKETQTALPENNPANCIRHCKRQGSRFAGVQNDKCRCGDTQPSKEDKGDECYQTCPGGILENCGGGTGWWNVFSVQGISHCNLSKDVIASVHKLSDELGKCVHSSNIESEPEYFDPTDGNFETRRACLARCKSKDFAALWGGICHCESKDHFKCYSGCKSNHQVCLINTMLDEQGEGHPEDETDGRNIEEPILKL